MPDRTGHVSRLWVAFGLSIGLLLAELIAGVLSNSLALIADAGHVLTDVSGLSLSLVAASFARRPGTIGRTYGWHRAEILAATVNGMLLFGTAGWILYEAWRRLSAPEPIETGLMLIVATVGLLGNVVVLSVLHSARGESLNMRSAYLEVLGDLLGSVAAIAAGLVIRFTGILRADAIASILVALLILPRAIRLLRDAVDILLEGTPRDLDLEAVRRHIRETPGVVDVHDLHAWTITSGMNVVSAHVVVDRGAEPATILDRLCECLSDDFDVEHSTFQLEPDDRRPMEEDSHP